MKKSFLAVLCLVTALLMATTAVAEPLLTNGTYTAYLGDKNFMYLNNSIDTRVLQLPVGDLVGMTDEDLYIVDQNGRLCVIKLDGSDNRVLSATPTADEIAAVTNKPVFTLAEDGSLALVKEDGSTAPVAANVLAATVAANTLYFVETDAAAGTGNTLKSLALDNPSAAPVLVRMGVSTPISLTASPTAVAMVTDKQTVEVVMLESGMVENVPTTSNVTAAALCFNGKLVQLLINEKGHYVVESIVDYPANAAASTASAVAPTAVPTASPAPSAPKPAVTAKPTQKPSSSSSSSSSNTDDGRISKGARGSKVRKMQERLDKLGYPVGKIDGVFGENTLLAVHLFQCAIGYTERSYASAKMLERLYNRDAPEYDPYAPLHDGDKGTDVKLMQEALDKLGYDIGKKGADGVFGKATKAAVEKFQFLAGFEVTGAADKDTLVLLFSEDAPKYTDKPVEKPTEPPTDPETPPTDPETPPTDPETPPTDPETPPTDPETPPTDPETPPTDPETPPTDPETPPTDPETPPTDPETPPTDPETPPTDPEASTTDLT